MNPKIFNQCVRKKSGYKHVPHAEKPVHVVEKRNARERRRVHAVNTAFVRLRKTIPFENKAGNVQDLYLHESPEINCFRGEILYLMHNKEVPNLSFIQRGKRVSKVRVLQKAIDYICNMRDTIRAIDEGGATTISHHQDDARLYHF